MDLPCASSYVGVVFYVNFPFYLIETIQYVFFPWRQTVPFGEVLYLYVNVK